MSNTPVEAFSFLFFSFLQHSSIVLNFTCLCLNQLSCLVFWALQDNKLNLKEIEWVCYSLCLLLGSVAWYQYQMNFFLSYKFDRLFAICLLNHTAGGKKTQWYKWNFCWIARTLRHLKSEVLDVICSTSVSCCLKSANAKSKICPR